ncbi:hypothetical protein [Metabacillus fastidiosus]|nr:hypothetical protein [Metabacillus fastidiosus]MEC2075243.1 hypothetical protein [Metabacillus fastidiosus]
MKQAKVLFILGTILFPISISFSSVSSIGILASIFSGLLIFFNAKVLAS